MLKHRRTALERVEKFVSATYFTDCNLRGRWAVGGPVLRVLPARERPRLGVSSEGSAEVVQCVEARPRVGGCYSFGVMRSWLWGGGPCLSSPHPGHVCPQALWGQLHSHLALLLPDPTADPLQRGRRAGVQAGQSGGHLWAHVSTGCQHLQSWRAVP